VANNRPMPDPIYLDTARWARREPFEYFRGFDKPYFNVCVRLDVAPLMALAARRKAEGRPIGLMLAYHHLALAQLNRLEPFRYRLEGGRVRVHPVVHGGCTVVRDDHSFGFADLDWDADFAVFARRARASIEACRSRAKVFDPRPADTDIVHFTTLPWLHFTSFSHARNWGREDSVPKLAFGRIDAEGDRRWLPCSVEVHHALMDGVHVGRFVAAFQDALAEPEAWLGDAPGGPSDGAPGAAPAAA
jgi:chloramphenicol O-acetyltransferase type A